MAPTTNQPVAPARTRAELRPARLLAILLLGLVVWFTSRQNLWWVSALVIGAFELLPGRLGRAQLLERLPAVIMGLSAALTITLLPKALSQLAFAGLYTLWRLWQEYAGVAASLSMGNLLIIEVTALEGVFLAAAVWNWSTIIMLILVWLVTYLPVWLILRQRGERGAAVLAAAWALVAAELTWVFMTWLVSYIAQASYLIVPQPALILATLAYCFGSIYSAQRQGKLNRARLSEYILIGIILIGVVIAGTPWRGSI